MAPVKFVQTPGLLLILNEDAPARADRERVPRERTRALAKSERLFLVPTLGTPLTFVKNERGEVTHLRITSVEGDIGASRLSSR